MDPISLLTIGKTLLDAGPAMIRGIGNLFGGKTAEVVNTAANIVESVRGAKKPEAALVDRLQGLPAEYLVELEKVTGEIKVELAKVDERREANRLQADAEGVDQFNKRINQHEGTAADLKTMPVLGRLMLFLRGCQRPVWGFGVLYMDVMLIVKDAQLPEGNYFGLMMLIINLLVLGFLFGERAVLNLQPLILRIVDSVFGKGK